MNLQLLFTVGAVLLAGAVHAGETAMTPPPAIIRRDLLTAALGAGTTVANVEIKEVTLGPRVPAPLHLHPCPVVGVILEGTIAYQREGQPVQLLHPGDAFYEPAGARVAHFDNVGDAPAKFTACYLLGPGEHELIRVLPK
jgi:quercetin dioxygenase-like cupin family protein